MGAKTGQIWIRFLWRVLISMLVAVGATYLVVGHPDLKVTPFEFGLVIFGVLIGFVLILALASQFSANMEYHDNRRLAARERARDKERSITAAKQLEKKLKPSVSTMPQRLQVIQGHIDVARRHFRERAFAPFWVSIESAASALSNVQLSLDVIANNVNDHAVLKGRFPDEIPKLKLSTDSLPDPRPLSSDLSALVAAAQKDYEFSMIYEQRKTNKILIQGFNSLHDALGSLADSIEDSMDRLARAIRTDIDRQISIIRDTADRDLEMATENRALLEDADDRYQPLLEEIRDNTRRD